MYLLCLQKRAYLPQVLAVTLVFGGGPFYFSDVLAQSSRLKLEYPIGVAVGNEGSIYVIDQQSQTIFRMESNAPLAVFYKGSKKYRTPLYRAKALVQDIAGNLFICDTGSMDVWRMTRKGQLAPMTGKKIDREGNGAEKIRFDPEARYAGSFDKPLAITLDAQDNLIVADLGLATVFRLPNDGGQPEEIARVPAPRGIALEPTGNFAVVSHGKNQLVRVSPDGMITPIVNGPIAPEGVSSFPHNVVVDQAGYIVSDGYAKTIWRISPDGNTVKSIYKDKPLQNPVGLALEPDGNILVADPHARSLFRITPDGQQINVVISN